MNNDRILKFPDGKGGIIYKKRTASGVWEIVNEDGSPKESVIPEPSPVIESPSEKPARKTASKKKTRKTIGMYLQVPEPYAEGFDEFILWKAFTSHERVRRGDVITEALELLFRKYPGFKEYRNKLKE